MDFPMAVDKGAGANLPDLNSRDCTVTLDDTALGIRFGTRFHTEVERSKIAEARSMPDPRPETYLSMGVSSGVKTLGTDTLSVIGSHDGLVEIVFREPVEVRVLDTDMTKETEAAEDGRGISVQRLIVSLQEPERFLEAFQSTDAAVKGEGVETAFPSGG
ncbi:MAG: hypothetical protein ACR2JC_00910 [Chloroflexota bacterium]|nr:MAG: hypothetical protein DLM70_08715 [Chloroflexota bacterium]